MFTMYVCLFCVPVVVTFFASDHDSKQLQFVMNMIAMVPASLLFSIEIIQIREQGPAYFAGWNLTDFTQFWVFLIITILNQQDIDDN